MQEKLAEEGLLYSAGSPHRRVSASQLPRGTPEGSPEGDHHASSERRADWKPEFDISKELEPELTSRKGHDSDRGTAELTGSSISPDVAAFAAAAADWRMGMRRSKDDASAASSGMVPMCGRASPPLTGTVCTKSVRTAKVRKFV